MGEHILSREAWVWPVLALTMACTKATGIAAEDCNGNLLSDIEETLSGLSTDCNGNGVPDECDVRPANFGFGAWKNLEGEFEDLVAGDLDGDGDMDLASLENEGIRIDLNDGDGSFPERHGFPGGSPGSLALADLDGDGSQEILDAEVNRRIVGVYAFRRGPEAPVLSQVGFVAANSPIVTMPSDLDGDEDLDLAVSNSDAITLFENKGDFVLEPRTPWGLEAARYPLVAFDAELDGDPDLVAWQRTQPILRIALFRNLGNWRFALEELDSPRADIGVAGDFDQDGDEDLALGIADGGIRILRNDSASGSFSLAASLHTDEGVTYLVTEDFDGNGAPDLVAGYRGGLTVFINSGVGSFQAREVVATLARTYSTSLAPGDLDRDGDTDLILSTFFDARLLENRSVALSLDCDRDGIPDECGPGLTPACEDCDGDGLPDSAEIRAGATDRNRNGILDRCEADVDFRIRFRAPGTVSDSVGTRSRFPAAVQVLSLGVGEGDEGLYGWSVLVGVDGGRITGATTLGTLAGPPPEGLQSNGFERTDLFGSDNTCEGGAFSAVVLSFMEPVTLTVTPSEILRLEVEAVVPATGAFARLWSPATCTRRWIGNADGEGGNHEVDYLVTWKGESLVPSIDESLVRLVAARFARGDANSDEKVDISDAIRTFMFLFLGASAPRCLDTADANDDGLVDISDGLHILNDFFREGTGIPDPGPFDCGIDPTPDAIGCAAYPICE